jgi:UDP-N-acetyl-D-glucosamine dehydrogenase
MQAGAEVSYNDPHVPSFSVGPDRFLRSRLVLHSQPLTPEALAGADCVVIVSGHSAYDYADIVKSARLVVDTVNATHDVPGRDAKVIRVGAPSSGEQSEVRS